MGDCRLIGKFAMLAMVLLVMGLGVGCNAFSAAPSECVRAAEDAGVPDSAIEKLRDPGHLNPVERAALRQVLRRAGIEDACEDVAGKFLESDGEGDDAVNPIVELVGLEGDAVIPTMALVGTDDEDEEAAEMPMPGLAVVRDDEHRRRCRFWALNNLAPVVYGEFVSLDPDLMDDLDRILWRSKMHGSVHLGRYDDNPEVGLENPLFLKRESVIYCREYWAEELNERNAELRNVGFEAECRTRLEERIISRYQRLREWVDRDDENVLAYRTPNQYVRVLEWLDLSGEGLLDADVPPYRVLEMESRRPYAHWEDWAPTEARLVEYRREYGERVDLEWLGIVRAAGLSDGSNTMDACHGYYPQLFFGYWIPFDEVEMSDGKQYEDVDLLRYEGSSMPVYLPKVVTADLIRAGYPLGKTAERYHLCQNSSETEEVGYYYVDHPAGDYCERKP